MADKNLVDFLEALTLKEIGADNLEEAAIIFYDLIILDIIRKSGTNIYLEPSKEIDQAGRKVYHLSYEIHYTPEELIKFKPFGDYSNGKFLVAKPPEGLTLRLIDYVKKKAEITGEEGQGRFIHVYEKFNSARLWEATLEQKDDKPSLVLENTLSS